MRIVHNEEIPVDWWDEFLSANPFASPFQSHVFYRLFNSVAGLSAKATAVISGDRISALAVVTFQKSRGAAGYFSRRAIIYGGPLADRECPDAFDMLIASVSQEIRRKVIYAETRNLSDYSGFRTLFEKHGWKYIPYRNFIVNTLNHEEMVRRISESRMRKIRHAKAAGVTWRKAESIADVQALYAILADLYRTKVKKPLLPWEFFRLFFEHQAGIILLVIHEGKIIGGIVCPVLGKRSLYEFYVCGLDNDYRAQAPSIMATWAAMEYAAQNGIQHFDFMGAGRPGEEYGVHDFKARFGGEPVEYGRYLRIVNPLLYSLGEAAINRMSVRKK